MTRLLTNPIQPSAQALFQLTGDEMVFLSLAVERRVGLNPMDGTGPQWRKAKP